MAACLLSPNASSPRPGWNRPPRSPREIRRAILEQFRIACFEGACVKLSQIFTAPNQLTLLRMIFVPFIVIHLVDGHYLWALVVFVIAGFSDGLDGLAGPDTASANVARAVSRSDRRQASIEHDVSGAFHPAQNSVEIHRSGVQPRYFDSRRQRCAVRDCRPAQFSSQHFWQGQHVLADRAVFFVLLYEIRPSRGYGSRGRSFCGQRSSSRSSPPCITSFWCSSVCASTRMLCPRPGIPPSEAI